MPELDPVERAVAELAAGRPVIVIDDVGRENEGDLVFAACLATPELLAFTIRHGSGVVCVPMPGERLDELGLQLMVLDNREAMRTAFTVSVDAADAVTTGISAADRARTVAVLADPASAGSDLVRPGHVFPLRYQEGGVLVRPGHTEAAVDLCRLAGLPPVGVICELVEDDGTMRRGDRLREFADRHGLALVSIEDLVALRRGSAAGPVAVVRPQGVRRAVERVAVARLPTRFAEFDVIGYLQDAGRAGPVALTLGDLSDGEDVLVRLHSECLTGDVFGSRRCDCGQQLDAALAAIADRGRGVLVYLRGHEGRGIGLLHKLRAYTLQDAGLDTIDANLALGLPADGRDYGAAAAVLADLAIRSVHLMTNNPAKEQALTSNGIVVRRRIALPVDVHPDNRRYLATKRDRMGHALDLGGDEAGPTLPDPHRSAAGGRS